MPSKNRDRRTIVNLDEMSDEELKLYAEIPNDIALEYLMRIYKCFQGALISQAVNAKQHKYPGIRNLEKYTGATNKDISNILEGKDVTPDLMDRLCLATPFALWEVLDQCEKKKDWPRKYIGKGSMTRIKKNAKEN